MANCNGDHSEPACGSMRQFFAIGFAPEKRIGRAVELCSYEIPGCTPEAIREAGLSGRPFTGFSTLSLSEGRSLGALPRGVKLIVARRPSDKPNFDVVVNGIGWMIVSNRLGDVFKKVAPNDIELLPVAIWSEAGDRLRTDFCVVNALRMLDALSEKLSVRSPVKWASGTRAVIKVAVVGNSVPRDAHVFRVIGCQERLLVDDLMKRALSECSHDGLEFIPIQQE